MNKEEIKAFMVNIGDYIEYLQTQLTEANEKLEKIEEENKVLKLLLEWMVECDFGLDNVFNEDDIDMTEEQFEKVTEKMDYNESLIYYATLYLRHNKGK